MVELLGLIVGLVLTLGVFSYLLGDNALYRWALAILVGAGVGYALGTVGRVVLLGWVRDSLQGSGDVTLVVPLLLGILLLLKGFNPAGALGRLATLGNIPLGFMVGVGAAVAVSGALVGTLLPQVVATGSAVTLEGGILTLVRGLLILIGTLSALVFFSRRAHSAQERAGTSAALSSQLSGARRWTARVGKFFIIVALGTAFAGALTSALTALVMRLGEFFELVGRLLAMTGG